MSILARLMRTECHLTAASDITTLNWIEVCEAYIMCESADTSQWNTRLCVHTNQTDQLISSGPSHAHFIVEAKSLPENCSEYNQGAPSDEVLTVHQPAVHSPNSPYIHYTHIYIGRGWENQSHANRRLRVQVWAKNIILTRITTLLLQGLVLHVLTLGQEWHLNV